MAVASFGIIVILIGGGLFIALQIVLSTRGNKWLGLILPVLSFVFSIVAALGYGWFYGMSSGWTGFLIVFAITNIPTLLYLGIYLIGLNTGNRNDKAVLNSSQSPKLKNIGDNEIINKSEIDKMKIDDL